MASVAELASYDSRIMRIVGFVALMYLPVSLVSVSIPHFALFIISGEIGCEDDKGDDRTKGYI